MLMEFPKQLKDQVYRLLQEPTLDKFREFLHAQMGEHNTIDFKSQWIENAALAKEMLALANSHGGFIVVVEDMPEYIPFLSKKESGSLKQNMTYVRRGTSCEIANEEELQAIFNRRMNYLHPLNGEPLCLEEHLKQLKILYKNIEKNHVYYKGGFSAGLASFGSSIREMLGPVVKEVEPNPLYPDESYEQFVSRMLVEKKKKIERVLDLH